MKIRKKNKNTMKKMLLCAALVLASTTAMAQKSNFQVKVDMKNFSADSVLVYKGRGQKMDTLLVKNNKFTYATTLDKPVEYSFITPKTYRGEERKAFFLICVPNGLICR